MEKNKEVFSYAKRAAAFLLCLGLTVICFSPAAVNADTKKTVRVGWYESPFCRVDPFGRRSGYAYEYQEKIAAYTGWNYEYVEGSWPELMQMLIDGKIDMLSDISYTEERAGRILYPSLPMGSEEYYIFISPGNTEYTAGNYSYFNGKRVGVNKGSFQAGLFLDWEKANGIQADLIELTGSANEAFEMMKTGQLDAFITLDVYGGVDVAVPVIKIGASDYFFAISKNHPELLEELNTALSRIQDENRFYNQQLFEKYFSTSGANLFLSAPEKEWLSGHGAIRVGYRDKYLSFCAADEKTGELTGALKDYLELASGCFENARLTFRPAAYPSAAAATEALKNGEVDCIFPSNFSTADGEELGLVMTPPMMTTEVYAVVRKDDQHSFSQKEEVLAAVEEGNPNDMVVIMDHFPGWRTVNCQDTHACLRAVAEGRADCVLISNYQYNNLGRQCDRMNLTPLATGKNVSYGFAVNRGNTELYSILTRTTGIISSTRINAALTYYSAEDAKTTLLDFIQENPAIDIAIAVAVIAMIVVIVMQQRIIRAKKEVEESQHQMDVLNRRVFVDALTSVRNKGGFNECIQSLQEQLDRKEQPEFGIVILDCDNLKQINDQYGHEKGDIYLQTASHLICRVYDHSPVFRIGGDEFAVVLQNEDYQNREALAELFEKDAEQIRASAENKWEQVSVAMGMAEYDLRTDTFVDDVVRRADITMYENKRARKEAAASKSSKE